MRYTLRQISEAIKEAGLTEDLVQKIGLVLLLAEDGKRRGRPPENDADALLEVARLVAHERQNPHAATRQVTADLPDSRRTTTQRRLYKKFKKAPHHWLARVPAPSPIEEAIQQLRAQLGPGAKPERFGALIRRVLLPSSTQKPE